MIRMPGFCKNEIELGMCKGTGKQWKKAGKR